MNIVSFLIRHEINRFECVHPLIYAAYDVLDKVHDPVISEKIRNHLIAIEDSFVNSQEWTLCRSVTEVRLGVLGSQHSGKSALVHYFLTGLFLQDDSPEGGRFKKLCFVQTQPCLLLIRDEPGPPDVQLASWIDALIFVVDLGDLESIRLVCSYYTLLCDLRDLSSIPIELVAIQDQTFNKSISSDVESGVRQLLAVMHFCPYYEASTLHGINVEPVFHDILSRVFLIRSSINPPASPTKSSTGLCETPKLTVNTARASHITVNSEYAPAAQLFTGPSIIAPPKYPLGQVSTAPPLLPIAPTSGSLMDSTLLAGLHTPSSNRTHNPVFSGTSRQQVVFPKLINPSSHSSSTLRPTPPATLSLTSMSASVMSPHPSRLFDQIPPALQQMQLPRASLSTEFPKRAIPDCPATVDSWPCSAALSSGAHPTPNNASTANFGPFITSGVTAQRPLLCKESSRLPSAVHSSGAAASSQRRPDVDVNSRPNANFSPRLSDESRPNRPRPQSTGSLSGPLSGIASATLCTMGLHSSSGASKQRDNVGAGRLIPLKQGYLYKHKTPRIGKEVKRKKKYVVITADARLSYHPSKQDYISGQRCKSIDLTITTVKLPGLAYRMSPGNPSSSFFSSDASTQSLTEMNSSFILPSLVPAPISTGTSTPRTSAPHSPALGLTDSLNSCHLESKGGADASWMGSTSPHQGEAQFELTGKKSATTTQQSLRDGGSRVLRDVMKRHHKKTKASSSDNSVDYENQEFLLVTADNTQWHFEASSTADRDDWIHHIDYVIHQRLRSVVALPHDDYPRDPYTGDMKSVMEHSLVSNRIHLARPLSFTATGSCMFKDGAGEDVCDQDEVLKRLTALPGNDYCADCGAPNPEWASLSLVVLVCIECSGVHRELGTHISRVRSAALDTWTREHLAVMVAFGNTLANSVWEGAAPSQAKQYKKPEPSSPREVRATWIQNKYVHRLFLPPLPLASRPIHQDLVDALIRKDMRSLLICLALCGASPKQQQYLARTNSKQSLISAPYNEHVSWTPLHLAAALGDLASTQLLLWHGADLHCTDQFGLTAWSYAHVCRQDTCARLLQLHGCRAVPVLDIPPEWLQRIINLSALDTSNSLTRVTTSDPAADAGSDSQSCDSLAESPIARRVPHSK
ncbi:unnamed protein product [Dicrocoelium dendriticum]|nr:unnamed protein product [Dicrocoelium dendriticum]